MHQARPTNNQQPSLPAGADKPVRPRSIHDAMAQPKRERQSLQHARLQNLPEQYQAKPVVSSPSNRVAMEQPPRGDIYDIRMDPARAKFELMVQPAVACDLSLSDNTRASMVSSTEPVVQSNRATVLRGVALVLLGLVLTGFAFDRYTLDTDIANGTSLVRKGQANAAVRVLTGVINRAPKNARAHFHCGLAHAANQTFDKSIKELTTAIECGGDKPVVLAARASVLLKMHQYDQAIDDCTSALFYDPKNLQAMEVRAVSHARKQDYAHVVEDCNAALQICTDKEDRQRLTRERGIALAKDHESEKAMTDLTAVLKEHPSDAIYLQRAAIYRGRHNYKAAVRDCTAAIKLNPWSSQGLVLRGMCLAKLHHRPEAIRDFTSALLIDNSSVEALIQRATVYMEIPDYVQARGDLRRALELNPYVPEAVRKLEIASSKI
jgi:tetratricopeptide (TPR) repeat protein